MQVALAWLLRRAPNILLIPGSSSVAHLRENLSATELDLPDGSWRSTASPQRRSVRLWPPASRSLRNVEIAIHRRDFRAPALYSARSIMSRTPP